ncbi:hypothetical protein EDB86DRAFT_3104439 [Lactarius hatsudake]|nr:hypothetical protein EDB86DRAFT_3104439 [Lactarius hatsudake]
MVCCATRFKTHAAIITGPVFLTALSGTPILGGHLALPATRTPVTGARARDGISHRVDPTVRATTAASAMANVQAALGISTLLCLVPVPLAATPQASRVAPSLAVLHVLLALRRSSTAARARGDRRIRRERRQQKPITWPIEISVLLIRSVVIYSTTTYWGATSDYTSVKYTTTDD